VNRLKLLKHQGYGRGKVDLLRKRSLGPEIRNAHYGSTDAIVPFTLSPGDPGYPG